MNRTCFFLLLILTLGCARTEEFKISSPDGKISLYFLQDREGPAYYVALRDTVLIDTSRLRMEFRDLPPLGPDLKLTGAVLSSDYRNWTTVWGEEKKIKEHYNRLMVTLEEKNEPFRNFHIEFKAFNDGVGFRYVFPEQKNWDTLLITGEFTEFNLADDYSAWWIPGDYDSNEHQYRNTPASRIDSAHTPVTFMTATGKCISIHEANLTDYAGMTLKQKGQEPLVFVSSLVPWPDGLKVRAGIPHQTPWRAIIIADDAAGLLLSRLILNLNEPNAIEDISWIRPMKYVGIWRGMHTGMYTWQQGPRHGATTENALRYIDFAAENGIGGVLIEGWNKRWETGSGDDEFDLVPPYDDFDIGMVAAYAKDKGVEIIDHHETGGNIPLYEKYVDTVFGRYRELGISAVKTEYAGAIRPEGQHHHGQWMVNHYRSVLMKALDHRIMINVHEPVKATGLHRTYPHMMTRGGARGIFDLYFNEHRPANRVHTTLAKQLALYVVLYSPFRMVAGLPENYTGHDAFEFIREVPCNWDETLVLNAGIGEYVTYARKKDGDWFIGAITDENERTHELKFDFLEKDAVYDATVYQDGDQASWEEDPLSITIFQRSIRQNDSLEIRLAKGGGAAIILKSR